VEVNVTKVLIQIYFDMPHEPACASQPIRGQGPDLLWMGCHVTLQERQIGFQNRIIIDHRVLRVFVYTQL
jgi:hypothetical protein